MTNELVVEKKNKEKKGGGVDRLLVMEKEFF